MPYGQRVRRKEFAKASEGDKLARRAALSFARIQLYQLSRHHFEHLLHQPLAVVFIDEVDGKERWQVQTGVVVPNEDGCALLLPPSPRPAFQLLPEWEERIKPIPDNLLGNTEADFAIYVRVVALPKDADLDDYSPTGINLNS